jgi:hypothetical protein
MLNNPRAEKAVLRNKLDIIRLLDTSDTSNTTHVYSAVSNIILQDTEIRDLFFPKIDAEEGVEMSENGPL